MKLAIPAPDRGFKLSRKGDYVLVTPGPTKMGYSDWEPNEYIYRSVVIHKPSEFVVSLAWPKFFNIFESGTIREPSPNDERLLEALNRKDSEIFFTEKVDGSLIVRSVVDGEVWIRTRGSLQENDHTRLARKIIEDRHPQLLDPQFMDSYSLLFELVSPDLRIILPYSDDLFLIGIVEHHPIFHRPYYFTYPHLQDFCNTHKELNLKLVPAHQLPTNIDKLLEAIKAWNDKEGIVIRYGDTLTKAKSARYLSLHRLRFALSTKRIKEICMERNVQQLEDFEAFLAEYDADWELFSDTKPLVETYLNAKLKAAVNYNILLNVVESLNHLDRKTFATEHVLKLNNGAERTAAFLFRDQKIKEGWRVLLEAEVDQAFERFSSLDRELEEAAV